MVTESDTMLQREVFIDATPETIWRLLVDPKEIVRWMGQAAAFDPRPGGHYRLDVIPGYAASGEIVEFDAPRRLVYTWGWGHEGSTVPPGSTTVMFELLPHGDGTLLRFTHGDLPSTEAAESHERGWKHYFSRLTVVAGGGDPGPDPWITGPML